jgi:hypothetical protein
VSDQLDLNLWPRQHDLPPRWDGLPVEWEPWTPTTATFICPPPRKPLTCHRCGDPRPPEVSIGRIWTDPDTAPPAIGVARLRNGRHVVAVISAHRCPGCSHDTVFEGDQAWDLDETDYTEDGSWDNASRRFSQ